MTVGLFVLGLAFDDAPIGKWLRHVDIEAHDGRGEATFTTDPALALRLPDHRAAMELWGSQSAVHPLRRDGRPNRPLTAFSVEVRPLP